MDKPVRVLQEGVAAWNKWKKDNPGIYINLSQEELIQENLIGIDFSGVDLKEADLRGAKLSRANLSGAHLSEAYLVGTNLIEADLSGAHLNSAWLFNAKLEKACLKRADLSWADLSNADFREANLREADLSRARLVETNLTGATLVGCRVYGISAWRLKLDGANQSNLVISNYGEPVITVDNLEVAQFIYLLLHSPEIRNVIDTIAKKAVLILGRFTSERKAVLDAMRDELRQQDYLPILFDWEKPASRDLVETISILAHMSRFIIADITDAKSIIAELQSIVPQLPSVAIQPIILSSENEYALFEHIRRYPWVLKTYRYETPEMLISDFKEKVILPAENEARKLAPPTKE